jgi:hydrogenase maturation protease
LTHRILVIGYGNTQRGDDGIGYRIAESLQVAVRNPLVEVHALPLLPHDLILDLAEARAALFIDADCRLAPFTWTITEVTPAAERTVFTSHLEPPSLLSLTQWLCGRCPEAYLLRVGARYFEFDDRLSAAMLERLPELVSAAESLLSDLTLAGESARGRCSSPLPIAQVEAHSVPRPSA